MDSQQIRPRGAARLVGGLLVVVLAGSGALALSSVPEALPMPTGAASSSAEGVSPNGTLIVGLSEFGGRNHATLWSGDTALVLDLATNPDGDSYAYDVTDGGLVVGRRRATAASGFEAFVWDSATGMRSIPYMQAAWAVSADGRVIVGEANGTIPALWREGAEIVRLTGYSGQALGVSADGTVVSGQVNVGGTRHAFRWTAADGLQVLDSPSPAYVGSYGVGLSADGSLVVGMSGGPPTFVATSWRGSGPGVLLGDLPGGSEVSQASDASADGRVIVGNGNLDNFSHATLWVDGGACRSIEEYLLTEYGVTSPYIDNAKAVSDDGRTIVGTYISYQLKGWRLTLPPDITPPTIELGSPEPAVLLPANGKMVQVALSGRITDVGGRVASASLEVVDEYGELNRQTDITGNLATDGSFSVSVGLRAKRDGKDKDGRIYRLVVRAADRAGNAAVPREVQVLVPGAARK
ncbi:MAG: hypothetical protein HZB16_19700 [Armatimonadetes bacterium]|nr:hypothetical protein [Armatimonadota bacterium]